MGTRKIRASIFTNLLCEWGTSDRAWSHGSLHQLKTGTPKMVLNTQNGFTNRFGFDFHFGFRFDFVSLK